MKNIKDLNQLIKSRRLSLDLSQEEAGALAGMSQQQYQKAESGMDIRISSLFKILDALKLDVFIDNHKSDEETPEGYAFMDDLLKGMMDDD